MTTTVARMAEPRDEVVGGGAAHAALMRMAGVGSRWGGAASDGCGWLMARLTLAGAPRVTAQTSRRAMALTTMVTRKSARPISIRALR